MKEMAQPALDYVLNGEVNLIPDKFDQYIPPLDGKCSRLEH
jgi:hypothetical protein